MKYEVIEYDKDNMTDTHVYLTVFTNTVWATAYMNALDKRARGWNRGYMVLPSGQCKIGDTLDLGDIIHGPEEYVVMRNGNTWYAYNRVRFTGLPGCSCYATGSDPREAIALLLKAEAQEADGVAEPYKQQRACAMGCSPCVNCKEDEH